MPEYVRVRDNETGHHYSVTLDRFERDKDLWQKLDQPATDSAGTPLPPKFKTTVSTETAKKTTVSNETAKKAGQKAATTTEKES